VQNGVTQVVEKFGKIDVLFNNAGITIHKTVLEADNTDWDAILKTNLLGEMAVAKAVGKHMMEKGIKGSIINMGSMSGLVVNVPQMQTLYNVSKAAVIHMTKCLAVEWADYGIRVNSLSPGYIATDMSVNVDEDLKKQWMELIPMRRMGTPSELSGAVIFLACDAAGYTTGCNLVIDGGYTCL
jgi:sorbose reductase